MEVSVIIVNYNVRHFLEQCLISLKHSLKNMDAEIFVVDNNSTDGSVSMLNHKFPEVKLICNSQNKGFGAANNQALKEVCGRYILFLNPDTLIEEKTIDLCKDFMDRNPDAGATGVRMIDGKGKFLRESKRALPGIRTAFYKISGLAAIFPHSKKFNHYYLSHLPENQVHKIDILSGAFFFTRKSILNELGHFDESFFMYGEDIDLSYRILKAGYNNYYLPEPSIIHYKGESTKKGNIDYVIHFYRAMKIFVRKHFARNKYMPLNFAINTVLIIRAALSALAGLGKALVLPFADFLISYLSLLTITTIWEKIHLEQGYAYPDIYRSLILPVYILIWIISIALWKGYRLPVKIPAIIKGLLSGSFTILLIYALLPLSLRYSRAIILFGSIIILLILPVSRLLMGLTGIVKVNGIRNRIKKVVIVSTNKEYKKIEKIISGSSNNKIIGRVSTRSAKTNPEVLGNLSQLEEIIRVNKIDEIVLSSSDLSAGEIIEIMKNLANSDVEKKIARTDSDFVIGSKSKLSQGEIYTFNF